jgi:hypothetical protein
MQEVASPGKRQSFVLVATALRAGACAIGSRACKLAVERRIPIT